MHRFSTGALALIACVVTTYDATAQPRGALAPLAESLTGEARTDYEAGKALYDAADFSGAYAKYRHAYERAKDPRLLWNMAVCEKQQRHYYRVRRLVEQMLDEGKGYLSSDQESQAKELIAAIRGLVGSLRVAASPRGAEVFIDDERVAIAPVAEPLPIDRGRHTLRVHAAGFVDATRSIDVAGSQEIAVDVALIRETHEAHLIVNAGANDTIALDGAVVAKGHWDAGVAPGKHRLRVTADGRVPYDAALDLADRTTRSVDVSLERKSGPVWPWIVGGVAVAAGAAVAGYFVFRPKDETVPPPQTSLGGVSLTARSF